MRRQATALALVIALFGAAPRANAKPAEPVVAQRTPLYRGARETLDGMALRSDRIQLRLREARARRYASAAACLHDLLSQAHATERHGLQVLGELRSAIEDEDVDLARAQIGRLVRLETRSAQLEAEAGACGRARPPQRSR